MTLLAIDPGETVGWAIFEGNAKVYGGQTEWTDFQRELARSFGVTGHPTPALPEGQRGVYEGVTETVGRDAVIETSFWRNEPAAELRGFANTVSSASACFLFSSRKSFLSM